MSLHLKHLKNVVRTEKAVLALRKEVARALGPIIDVTVPLRQLAEDVNDRLQVLSRTGRLDRVSVRQSVMSHFAFHRDPEVRKMAAQLLPESFLPRLSSDKDAGVRAAVANRASLVQVKEMMRNFPSDDELRAIYNRRKPVGMKVIKEEKDEEFDIHGDEPLGDAGKTFDIDDDEMSDVFYEDLAHRCVADYDREIEVGWEEKVVANLVRAFKATSNVELDPVKLMKAIKELLEKKDELGMIRGDEAKLDESMGLKDLARSLREAELSDVPVFPMLESEDTDPVYDLVRSSLSPETYVREAIKVFRIQQSTVPGAIKKYRLGENSVTYVPMKARLPHGHLRQVDERALDLFVDHWNGRQALAGEPLKLSWNPDPSSVNAVGFNVSLT
jgi:hypothetical protein